EVAAGCREVLVGLRGIAGGIKLMNQAQFRLTLDTKELGMGLSPDFAWVGFGVLHGSRRLVRAAHARLKELLRPYLWQIIFLNEQSIRRFRAIAKWTPGALGSKLRRQVRQGEDVLQIVRGEPRSVELRLVYQHVPVPADGPLDPVKEGVGV